VDRLRADTLRLRDERRICFGIVLRRNHGGAAALEDAGLLSRDLDERVAEVLGVIAPDRRHDGRCRLIDHVRRIRPAAEPHLEQKHVPRRFGEEHERRRGRDLEHSDLLPAVDLLATPQRLDEPLLVDEAAAADAAEADALVKAHQMRRGVDVDRETGAFEDCSHKGDRRALAVGAGDVDHGRQAALWVVELAEQPLDAHERQVDRLWMQRQEARDQRVGGLHPGAARIMPRQQRRLAARLVAAALS
jgi:hypothetical protein